MAIDTESTRFLFAILKRGVSFRHCVTLGRQHFLPSHQETRLLLKESGFDPGKYPKLFAEAPPRYSEPLWEMLGAERLETMDASAFEGASITHDLNQPVPPELKGKFDAVIDAGTLEHVFDVPTALRGCLEMVKPGGHFVSFAPANNYFGHGFYQFSPELFFRVLSPANGFRLEWMVAVEYGPRRRWFEVSDPEAIKSRVVLINHFPVLLFLYAKKVASVELLTASPLQSDYVAMWADTTLHPDKVTASAKGLSARLVPRLKRWLTENTPGLARFLEAFLFSSLNRDFSFRNCRSFKRLDKKRP